jgi:hypothetical protein
MSTSSAQATDGGGKVISPPPIDGATAPIQFDVSDVSANIAVLPNRLIQVKCTVDCYYKLGAADSVVASATTSATAASQYLPAGVEEIVETGAFLFLAAIRKTGSGQMTISYLKG